MNHTTKIFAVLIATFALSFAASAQSVDGSFAFQTDPDKKFSLYVPSSYDEATPQSLMLALHPFNTNRWDAVAWRDTLISFAEENELLMVCPDGGSDGRVDDAIDTAFTTVLIDSVSSWYNIDQEEKYMMGFSWGGKTTYTYGLRRAAEYKGFLVIGAAVNIGEVSTIVSSAQDENFYLVHGTNDSPNVRYEPLLEALQDNGACVETELMSNVGHTIDFPNRNEILATAFQWLKSNECGTSASEVIKPEEIIAFPNPFTEHFQLSKEYCRSEINLVDHIGREVSYKLEGRKLTPIVESGSILFLSIRKADRNTKTTRILKY